MVRLEVVAKEKGYLPKMETFLRSYVLYEMNSHCDFFLQISDVKEIGHNYYSCHRYISLCNFEIPIYDLREDFHELIIEREAQHHFEVLPFKMENVDWNSYIDNSRRIIEQAKYEKEQKRMERNRLEKERFAENLSPEIPLISPNLGIRVKQLDRNTEKYTELNELLKDIYERFYPHFDSNSIYKFFQQLKEKEIIVRNVEELELTLERISTETVGWSRACVNASFGTWVQVIYTNRGDTDERLPSKPENIKVYAYLKNGNIRDVFVDSLRHLLKNASQSFAAKIAKYNRSDQMCYWLSLDDFKYLEDFFTPYSEEMALSMPFVAYKGKLGISKEFPGIDHSHNSTQAYIIADYLKTVKAREEICLEDMYNHFIAKWNADIDEENAYGGFKNSSALLFVVIMDTLDVITGRITMAESSLLKPEDNRAIWRDLADSRCWADLNEKWKGVDSSANC